MFAILFEAVVKGVSASRHVIEVPDVSSALDPLAQLDLPLV